MGQRERELFIDSAAIHASTSRAPSRRPSILDGWPQLDLDLCGQMLGFCWWISPPVFHGATLAHIVAVTVPPSPLEADRELHLHLLLRHAKRFRQPSTEAGVKISKPVDSPSPVVERA